MLEINSNQNFREMLSCGRKMKYPIEWSLVPTFLRVTETTLGGWGEPSRVFSAITNTAEKNQAPKKNLLLHQQPSSADYCDLAVPVMRFPISVWVSDLLVSISVKKRLNPAFICTSAFHGVLWSWPAIGDFHLLFTLQYHCITGMAVSGLWKVYFQIIKTVFHFCSHI